MTPSAPAAWPTPAEVADLRLLAVDLDGTLLDPDGHVDERFWALADRLSERGVQLCAATGRQRHSLVEVFGERLAGMSVICDNGALVEHHGRVLHTEGVAPKVVAAVVHGLRTIDAGAHRLAIALSTPGTVWLEATSAEAQVGAEAFFHHVTTVPDVLDAAADTLKVSVYSVDPLGPGLLDALAGLAPGQAVVQGHDHWADVNGLGAAKGTALRRLQDELGVGPAQTAAFGDHLNDVGMLGMAAVSFAMANAQPDVLAAARFRAPSNADAGVVRALEAILDLMA